MAVIKVTINNSMGNKNHMIRNLLKSVLLIIISFSLNNAQSLNGSDVNTSSLAALNMINVTIGGDFPMSGTYPASRTERVDQLVTRILVEYRAELLKTTTDEQLLGLIKSNTDDFAKRNIILKRINGENIDIDLVKFRLTGDFNFNPYLNNDDVLIFPPLDLDRNFIQISGAVNKELKFEFVDGEKLSDAIIIAHGLNLAYTNVDSVEISRLSYDGQNENIIVAHIYENPILERGDRIRILSDETRKRDFSVLVLGEVKRPGKVYITKNTTKLSDVIDKVGGFTSNASLKFSELIRNYDSFSSLKKMAIEKNIGETTLSMDEQNDLMNFNSLEFVKMFRSANLEMADTLYFGIDNKLRALDGYSHLDFRNLENDSSYESNYLVNEGDVIIVPEISEEVYLWGGVARIGYYRYDKNMTVWDYIETAGGFTEIAYGKEEVYLIKGKSRDWLTVEDYENLNVEPGDYIYVKKETPVQEFWFYLGRIGAVTAIIGSLATIILLVNQIK